MARLAGWLAIVALLLLLVGQWVYLQRAPLFEREALRRLSALLIALGPGGSLLLALAFVFLSARAAGSFEDPEVGAAVGLVDGLLLAVVLGRQPPAWRRALRVLLEILIERAVQVINENSFPMEPSIQSMPEV